MRLEAGAGALLFAAATALFVAAYQAPTGIFLDFGPNDFPYVSGFREEFEIDEQTLIRWSRQRSQVQIPLILGPDGLEMSFRYKRHAALPADVRVFLGGVQVDRFLAPQQGFTVRTVRFASNPKPWTPVEITLLTSSQDPRPLGLALDWLQIRPSGVVLPTARSLLYAVGFVFGLYLVPRLIGFSRLTALTLGLGGAAALSLMAISHKLFPLHATQLIGARGHVVFLLAAVLFRRSRRHPGSAFAAPEARWALLACYLGTLVRLMGLFHPEFYYPDVRTHSKFVSLIWTEGLRGFLANHIEDQHRYLLGLQLVGKRWLAFPYPPLLYLVIYPLSLLRLPVDDWMKMVPTVLIGAESLVVYAVAHRLGATPRAAALATSLHAAAPLVAFRLTVASYAALFGHFWDMLVAAHIVFLFERMNRIGVGLGLALLVGASLLSYAGSALVLGLFVPVFSLAVLLKSKDREGRTRALRVALWALAGALLAMALFYVQYVPELVPAWTGGEATGPPGSLIEPRLTPFDALSMAARRLLLFYGPVYSPLLLVALLSLRGKPSHRLAGPLVAGTLVTFFGLNFLRSGLGSTHIFQFTKDDLVLLPLATVALGSFVDRLLDRGRLARLVGITFLVGWIGWGCVAMVRNVRSRFLRQDYQAMSSTPATPLGSPSLLGYGDAVISRADLATTGATPGYRTV